MYNGEFAIFYTKSEAAQKFVINTINGKIPGVEARGPRLIIRPNFHVEFPDVLDRMQPELLIARAISMHVGINCAASQVQICSVKKNDRNAQ